MSSRAFLRFAAGVATAATFSLTSVPVQAGGGCGCEGPSSTVYHVHSRCHHGCRHCPPTGMVVQSMPMMAAPVMAAPMMMAAPVAMAPAPTMALAPAQPSYQLTLAPQAQSSTCAGMSQDQFLKALAQTLTNDPQIANALRPGAAPARALDQGTEERLDELQKRISRLETATKELDANTKEIIELMKLMQKKNGN